jgi:hypothetical protein
MLAKAEVTTHIPKVCLLVSMLHLLLLLLMHHDLIVTPPRYPCSALPSQLPLLVLGSPLLSIHCWYNLLPLLHPVAITGAPVQRHPAQPRGQVPLTIHLPEPDPGGPQGVRV